MLTLAFFFFSVLLCTADAPTSEKRRRRGKKSSEASEALQKIRYVWFVLQRFLEVHNVWPFPDEAERQEFVRKQPL